MDRQLTSAIPQPHSVLHCGHLARHISHRTYLLGPAFLGTLVLPGPTSVLSPVWRFSSERLH